MLREVQAHFENQGALNWTTEIADPFVYLNDFKDGGWARFLGQSEGIT